MAEAQWPNYDRKAELAWVRQHSAQFLPDMIRTEKRELAQRIAATRRSFRFKAFVGDTHSHSKFSDGAGTIAENKEVFDLMGYDFAFITDHRTLRHKPHCEKLGLGWGQEPPSCGREIAVLMPRRLLVPHGDNLAGDFDRARRLAPFAWIPHPAGYARNNGAYLYPKAMAKQLWTLGERFAIEILNGGQRIERVSRPPLQEAVCLWDKLLCAGRNVTVIGGSDAHNCWVIGTAWSGVYAKSRAPQAIAEALNRGHCFASEAPLLWLACGRATMGDDVRTKPGQSVSIRYAAADSAGLHSVRIVSGGAVIHEIFAKGTSEVSGEVRRVARKTSAYFRLECVAADGRLAFSSPIFCSNKAAI